MPEHASPLLIRCASENDIGALLDLYEHLVPAGRQLAGEDAKAIWQRFSLYEGSAIFLGIVEGKLVSTCTLGRA